MKTIGRTQPSDNGHAMFPSKVRISKIPGNISVPLAMGTNPRKKVSNFSKTPKKKTLGRHAMFPSKVRISKIPAKRFLYPSRWAQIFEKKLQTFQKPRKKKPCDDLGPRSA